VHGLDHLLEHGVEELPRFLWIAVGEELNRALQVGEEHGDLLALALQSSLGVEDALGEVLRGVALGRGEARGRWSAWRQSSWVGALRTELGRRGEMTAAVSTCPRQGRGALLAELRTSSVFVLAPRAFHRGLGLCGRRPVRPCTSNLLSVFTDMIDTAPDHRLDSVGPDLGVDTPTAPLLLRQRLNQAREGLP
jgi:hypothetical protein